MLAVSLLAVSAALPLLAGILAVLWEITLDLQRINRETLEKGRLIGLSGKGASRSDLSLFAHALKIPMLD